MSLSFFCSESINSDRTALALGVLRIHSEDVGATSLKASYVEVGDVALNLGHDGQSVTVFGFQDEGLG